jgi:hypothetical protein
MVEYLYVVYGDAEIILSVVKLILPSESNISKTSRQEVDVVHSIISFVSISLGCIHRHIHVNNFDTC